MDLVFCFSRGSCCLAEDMVVCGWLVVVCGWTVVFPNWQRRKVCVTGVDQSVGLVYTPWSAARPWSAVERR